MRFLAWLAVVPALSLAVAAQTGPPATHEAAWWGSVDPFDGWHVRVAHMVTNPLDRTVRDVVAGSDVPLRDLLVDGGWVRARTGGGIQLQAFELDERSVRVIEHAVVGGGLGPILREVPSRATLGGLDAPGVYNNRTMPTIHVEWVLPGPTPPGASRAFMIYVDTVVNGPKPASSYDEAARAPLDARYWIGRGTVLHGVGAEVGVVALEPETRVFVEPYDSSRRPRAVDDAGTVLDGGAARVFRVNDEPTLVRVRADKPVLAYGARAGAAGAASNVHLLSGPVPSADATGPRGTEFVFETGGQGYQVYLPEGSTSPRGPGLFGTLTRANPARGVYLTSQGVAHVTSDLPLLVSAWPHPQDKAQLPSAWGAPLGSRLVGLPFGGWWCNVSAASATDRCPGAFAPCRPEGLGLTAGEVVVSSPLARTHYRGSDVTGELRFPVGPDGKAGPESGFASPEAPGREFVLVNFFCPALVHPTSSLDARDYAPGTLAVFAGGQQGGEKGGLLTPLGGLGSTRFESYWPVQVVAWYDATRVTFLRGGREVATAGLGRSDVALSPAASFEEPLVVVADKPIAVLPREAGAYFAGLDRSLVVRALGPASYRGHLVSLEPAGGATEPLVALTGPGAPVTITLLVKNLAKDERGRGVPDTIRLSVPAVPDGWLASLSRSLVRLAGGESTEVQLTVTPPVDAKEGARLALPVRATSEADPAIEDRVPTVTLVRATFGVDLWFDRPDGPKSKTLTMDAGETRATRVVVKNLASIADRITLVATPLSTDWSARLEGAGKAGVLEIALEPGESRILDLAVAAPPDRASQSLVEISAVSAGSAAAAAKIDATVRIRPDTRIALDVAEPTLEVDPGTNATFHVVFRNRGQDTVGIRFNATGARPAGWSTPIPSYGGFALDELSGIPGGSTLTLNLTLSVPTGALRAERAKLLFTVETLPQAAGDPVVRESVDLLVLVARRHALTLDDPPSLVPLASEGVARLRVALENRGNGDETILVVPRTIPAGAALVFDPPVEVARGGRGVASALMSLPSSFPPGLHPVDLALVADDGHATPWSLNLSVPVRRLVNVTPLAPTVSIAGVVEEIPVEIANEGNVDLALPPAFDLPGGWDVDWAGANATLAPAAVVSGQLRILAPVEAASTHGSIAPDPRWADGVALVWEVRTVRLAAVIEDGGEPSDGGVRVRVHNAGTGDAHAVLVTLESDGVVLDRVHLARIAAGANATAVLARPAGEGTVRAIVRVDPSGRYPVDEGTLSVVLGERGDRVPVPTWAFLSLAAGALLGRRRR